MEVARKDLATVSSSPSPQTQTAAILDMIGRAASDPSVDIDKMERLLSMQERMIAQRAASEFAAAFSQMQGDLPVIVERGAIDHGNNRGVVARYALWDDINEAIKPVLQKHGFGLRFAPGRAGERLTVTGFLSHEGGHVEQATMELPTDTSGSKNAVQAIGSSTSYGKRYIASALLNLTSRLPEDKDDDGRKGGASPCITEDQLSDLDDMIEAVGADRKRFCQHLKVARLADLPAAKFDEAFAELKRKERRW